MSSVNCRFLYLAVTYIGGVIIFTKQVNLPLNYYTESSVPTSLSDDWMETRNSWNDANAIRGVTSFLPFLFCVLSPGDENLQSKRDSGSVLNVSF
ncbi:DUF1772 domain-containing protein [Hahella sp. KA22]|uniref:DUF1772 domain-containing protein n=1 Tax=Hahella sp. KA22 TaxID=1628392 RepID=UPI000FDDE049|nr:DUF1772 domain-containing protein [Hahella sp. KA22]AZZ92878.1 DUF1772 domain-containing protein [Hahella sp. KA22]QAY56252.1 DUF1772 domain-containing protein [Hahella sp. KA22]